MICLTVIVLLVVLATCGECSDGHHYYVTAENGSDCPPFVPCHSLSHYVQDRDRYFTSDTVIEFLPGLHELNHSGHVWVELVENLTIIGSSSFINNQLDYSYSDSVVNCTDFSGFMFIMVRDLRVINITLSNCGAIPLPLYNSYIALAVIEVTSLLLDRVTIEKSHGFGLFAMHIWNNSLITSCTFASSNENVWNRQECLKSRRQWMDSPPSTCLGGNARLLYADTPLLMGSSNDSVQVEIKDSIFSRGVAGLYVGYQEQIPSFAGGLDITLGAMVHDVSIIVNNSIFTNNTGSYGANIAVLSFFLDANVILSVRIDRCQIQYGNTELNWPQRSLQFVRAAGITHFAKQHVDKSSVPLHISNTNFMYNLGGALELGILARESVVCNGNEYEIIIENCTVSSNLALSFPAAMSFSLIYQKPPVLETVFNIEITIKNSEFHQNVANYPETYGILRFYQLPKLTIINSTFVNNCGSPAIDVYMSKLYLQGKILFQNNTSSTDGGALYIHDNAFLYFHPNTTIAFIGNSARLRGGAIYYVESHTETGIPHCFFQLEGFEVHNYVDANVQLTFEGNHAAIAGDAIYGGRVDSCLMYSTSLNNVSYAFDGRSSVPSIKVFKALFNFTQSTPSLSLISSNPIGIRFCNNTSINYTSSQTLQKQVYPGQLFEVGAVAVGQYYGTTPGVVSAAVDTSNTAEVLETVQVAQETHTTCTNLQYRILSSKSYEVIHLQPARVSRTFLHYYANILMNITLLDCPPGFELQRSYNRCDCHSLLHQFNVTCDINNQTITKKDRAWISHNPTSGLLLHAHCPFDYCRVGIVTFKLEDPDKQCAFSRVGTLCGACQEGLSLALGTSRCLKCSNVRLALLLPFAVAGVALVFVLLTLNFTVSTGTVNGLIFYVNVVRANHAVFFPPGDRSVFSVFIAWLNLDLGIETCFCDGLDGYAKTWLQLVFPIYIWAMVVVIIVLSRRYVLAAKLCGSHSVQVLATLFLLSYAKVLRTIITTFSFTLVNFQNGKEMTVWLYDGNINYLGVKHVFLFLTALGFAIFYVLPFTMLVLLAPCLQAHSNKPLLRWVHRVKPFLDAYQGPYEDKFRCWTGVMLVVRNVLFLAFALNGPSNPMVNLGVISTVVIGLLGCMWLAGSVYKVMPLNLLEAFFIIKLGLFSVWTSFIHHDMSNSAESQMIAAYVITSTTMLLFLVIVACHVYCWVQRFEVVRDVISKLQRSPQEHSEEVQNNDQSLTDRGATVQAPTVTYIDMRDLREPLLSGDGHEQ